MPACPAKSSPLPFRHITRNCHEWNNGRQRECGSVASFNCFLDLGQESVRVRLAFLKTPPNLNSAIHDNAYANANSGTFEKFVGASSCYKPLCDIRPL